MTYSRRRLALCRSNSLSHSEESDGLESIGYAEAMLVAYNRKCKYPLRWTKLYEKNLGTSDGLDVDTDSPADEEEEFDSSVRSGWPERIKRWIFRTEFGKSSVSAIHSNFNITVPGEGGAHIFDCASAESVPLCEFDPVLFLQFHRCQRRF